MDNQQESMLLEMEVLWNDKAALDDYLELAKKYITRGMYMREMTEVTGHFWNAYYSRCKEIGNQELLDYIEGTVGTFCDISANRNAEPELPFPIDDRPER